MVGETHREGFVLTVCRKWHATCGTESDELSSCELGINSVCLVEPVLGLYRVLAGRWGESLGITFLSGSSGPVITCCNGSCESVLKPHSERLRRSGSDADVWFSGVVQGHCLRCCRYVASEVQVQLRCFLSCSCTS